MPAVVLRRRREPVHALRWTGEAEALWPAWVGRCCVVADGELWHERRSGRQRVERGEWLVRDLDGSVLVYTDDEIRRGFEARR
jgi:hypothetical protein